MYPAPLVSLVFFQNVSYDYWFLPTQMCSVRVSHQRTRCRQCIGKQVFRKRAIEHTNRTQAEIDQRRYELTQLETTFLNKMYEQVAKAESSSSSGAARKKSAAAAGRAMLQARNKSNVEGGGKLGLFAQLQSSGGGMIDNSLAGDYLKKMTEAQQTGHYPSSYAPLGGERNSFVRASLDRRISVT